MNNARLFDTTKAIDLFCSTVIRFVVVVSNVVGLKHLLKGDLGRVKKRLPTTALEQYGRRETLRIYIVPESNSNIDNGEEIALHIAKKINVNLTDMEIQRAHR